MIVGHISNIEKEAPAFHPAIVMGLKFLANADFGALSPGRYTIDGDDMYVNIDHYQTEPKEIRRPEAHQKYIDIQYLIAGEEIIGVSLLASKYPVMEDKLATSDVIFYQSVDDEADVIMTQGMYAVLFPWDVHRPCCNRLASRPVRKAVVKIRTGLLTE
ncbi:MAG TPA: YhcH/YjgK/YiaL family protein [Methylomusa anaerophila]|uniref:Toxin-antitoxin biofilm protein TabA n=1 Tax=Methylomusa anaerophila TaxID=1930071 RepID=A0A348AMN5_9FIRM|nr:YhcH/YjgK/YiaL family protein [Methylomusa anaerophila]BBB92333.1 toxin-antitoxin biofilm protein TabA [Methylomusa anaerophila]HML90027.1 YhcH/YjgK/YiaL family protein [Methylomusa anaerophila]